MENNKKILNAAVYGCGVIAKTHAKALDAAEGVQLYACADINLTAAENFAKEYGIAVFRDYAELLASSEVDVICICTPSGTHEKLTVEALRAGKNVILEKPMGLNAAECDEIIAAERASSGKVTVISQMRTSPDIRRAKELITSGKLGKLILGDLHMCYYRNEDYYKGSWRGTKAMDGGGALMNQGIHGVDVLCYLMGDIRNVGSVVRTLAHDIEVEDTATAAVEFENGALGVISASTATYPGFDREMTIRGTRGSVEFREGRMIKAVIDGKDLPCEDFISDGGATTNMLLDVAGHTRQISDFVRVLNGEDIEYVSAAEGRRAVEVIERIYENSL